MNDTLYIEAVPLDSLQYYFSLGIETGLLSLIQPAIAFLSIVIVIKLITSAVRSS